MSTLSSRRLILSLVSAALLSTAGQAAFDPDGVPIASLGGAEMINYNLSATGGAILFRGDYIRSTWDGDLAAYNISSTGVSTLRWNARKRMAAQGWANRKIATYGASAGVPFAWASLTATQQAALGNATTGPQLLSYLRGDASRENTSANTTGAYRQRYSPVGAIIRSRPYFWSHGKDSGGNAIGRVYVGTNYGTLQAFDAYSGDEAWAYVPSMLISKLPKLASTMATRFPYYVDGQIAIADVATGSGTRTQLVSGLGSGARGLFSLNLSTTSPANDAAVAAMAMWEITSASSGFGNLGYTFGAPRIVKLNNGTWAVLAPNGPGGAGGTSSLFVIDAATGARISEVAAGTGPDNGLGGVAAVDVDRNGTADIAFAGDLAGNLWRFDLTTFGATLVINVGRPITAAPSVIFHPQGGLHVNFGTGMAYETADLTSTGTDYLYGIRVDAAAGGSLRTNTLTEVSITSGGQTTRYRTASAPTAVNYSGGDRGWRVALPAGERVLDHNTATDAGRFIVTTAIPGTGSWTMQIDALSGASPAVPVFDVNGDGIVGAGDTVTAGTSTANPVGKYLGGGIWSQPILGRLSPTLDLPIFNYNENLALTPFEIGTGAGGVAGGHFDADIYYGCTLTKTAYVSKTTCGNTHTHEYDDKFNVVGVEMLNASNAKYNLSEAIPSTSTSFKVLVANTNWNPAARLNIKWEGVPGVANGEYSDSYGKGRWVWDLPLSPEGFLAATPGGTALTFTRTTLKSLQFYMPLDGFSNAEWRPGSGDVRSGLMPSQTGCVTANEGADGKGGTDPWANGALTVQVVSSAADGADVMAAKPTTSSTKFGDAAGGYRLKSTASQAQSLPKMLAQYTYFWHHPNKACAQDADWVKNASPDTDSPRAPSPVDGGSKDPTGSFTFGPTVPGGTPQYSYGGVAVTVERTFSDAGVTQIIRRSSDKATLNTSYSNFGLLTPASRQLTQQPRTGRLGWREMVR